MNKLVLLGIAATLGAAKLAFLPTNLPVELQPTSPGTTQTGHLNISGTATVGLLKSQGTVFGASTAPTGFAYGGFFTAASNQGRGFYGYASSPTGLTYGGFFQNASEQGRAVYGLATATSGISYGGYFQTASTGGRAIYGVATSGSGTTFGVYGRTNSPTGYGVYSDGNMAASGVISGNGSGLTNLNATNLASGTVPDARLSTSIARRDANNVFTSSLNQFSSGFVAVGPRTSPIGTGEFFGVSSASPSWTGMYVSSGSSGLPYYGYNNVNHGAYSYLDASGTLRFIVGALEGLSIAPDGKLNAFGAVTARTSLVVAPTDEPNESPLEVRGDSMNRNIPILDVRNGAPVNHLFASRQGASIQSVGLDDCISVAAIAQSTTPTAQSWAVVGRASGIGQNIGIYGEAMSGTSNWAGWFEGMIYASSASAGVKSFMIDHPLDPANKVLTHSSVESDERKNVYDGVVKTDANGFATVTMPPWFEALNQDFRYQLTVNGDESADFVQVKVARKLQNGKFKIRTSAPFVEVNWQVTGNRHDPTSNYYPLEVERTKTKDERGRYYEPRAFGMDERLGIATMPTATSGSQNRPAAPTKK